MGWFVGGRAGGQVGGCEERREGGWEGGVMRLGSGGGQDVDEGEDIGVAQMAQHLDLS